MSAVADPLAFELLGEAAEDHGYGGDSVAIGGEDLLVTILLLPGRPEQVGCHFTLDVFAQLDDPRGLVDRVVQQMAGEVGAKLAALSPEDEALDRLREAIPHLRHAPKCPIGMGMVNAECVCGLDSLLEDLGRDYRLHVVRCRGCGQHAENGDGSEDWAWRGDEPFCHECAVALGA